MNPDDFTPTPGTLATAMYFTGLHRDTEKPIFVARNQSERMKQRRILEKIGQNRLGIDIARQFDDDPHAGAVALVAQVGDAFNLRNCAVAVALRRGLINAFELEHEEEELQHWLKRYKSGRG